MASWKWIFPAMLMLAGYGCSPSEADGPSVSVPVSLEGIAPRDVPTTTETIQDFRVWAYYLGQYNYEFLMQGVEVNRTGPNRWSYSPAVDWPQAPVDFYAVSPSSNSLEVNPHWKNMIKLYKNSGREDLLVAVKIGASQGEGNIRLNFRHALSQVRCRFYTGRSDLRMVIRRVTVMDIPEDGEYVLPDVTTSAGGITPESRGQWTSYRYLGVKYVVFDAGPGKNMAITTEPDEAGYLDARFFIPAKLVPLKHEGASYFTGARMEVLYQVYDAASGKLLWPLPSMPSEDTDPQLPFYAVARYDLSAGVPDATWIAGCRYSYTVQIVPPEAAGIADPACARPSAVRSRAHGLRGTGAFYCEVDLNY